MEVFDLYTRDRKLTGNTLIRGEEIPEGFYHLVISVWIKNKKGKYLLSKRTPNKKNYPNMWECTNGNIQAGETSLEGAVREVREETGIELQESDLKLVKTEILEELHYIYDIYEVEYNGRARLAKALTPEEVTEVKWLTKAQIENLHLKHLFRDDLLYFFSMIQPGGNYTYMVECKDGSYYTGWTNDLTKRLEAHNSGNGAKYTKNRRPVKLVHYEEFDTKIEAMQREYAIKQLSRKEKEALIG